MCWVIKKFGYRIAQKVLKIAMCFMNWKEPELLEGEGAILKLPSFIKNKNINKVLIVTDKGLMNLHLLDPLFEELKKEYPEASFHERTGFMPAICLDDFSRFVLSMQLIAVSKYCLYYSAVKAVDASEIMIESNLIRKGLNLESFRDD